MIIYYFFIFLLRERERFITSDIAFTDKWTAGPTAKAKIHRLQKYKHLQTLHYRLDRVNVPVTALRAENLEVMHYAGET